MTAVVHEHPGPLSSSDDATVTVETTTVVSR